MRSLDRARTVCEHYHPGLLKALEEIPFDEREKPGSTAIDLFRAHGGVGLLIPAEFGGSGASPLEAVRVQEALGAVAPSLAAATTMHHFTAAMLYALADQQDRLTPAQVDLLHRIVPEQKLMASGWAEGRTQQNILAPTVAAVPAEGGYRLQGSKKPCSLSSSMDLLTASISVPGADGAPELALAIVPADSPGLSVHPFWGTDLLAGAESDEVRLEDVFVPDELVVRTSADDPTRLDDLQTAGFIWFVLLISAGYTGATAALVEEVVTRERGNPTERAALSISHEAAVALLEGAARAVQGGVEGEEAVAGALIARYTVQDALVANANRALELLGGMDFIKGSPNARLAASVRPLAFHPPARPAAAEPLLRYFGGGPLELA
ncbi:acyl-CoA dehydrogenase family protein [Streptomyces caelestis]|uniref:Alkylation response protein AidB-like acyl-CoA dehydrogenase n=1 Tax=Streptomyces caelestis TaxID=36816 RepID=A0A7W9GY36_9ACTN|nr:acyl-CoA dehydrogenase family protein [Streptomyces caelestis]MBB5792127.1 alkylation response protein AidB-like acyl-CoA dehydrogenase [Streptomyces caelestis]GGW79697.1 putative oxidoreductase [Streptomyces caelestis]